MSNSAPRITRIRPADANSQVVTVEGGKGTYRRQPCPKCPWRVDATGEFPAEAFRHSAGTAYYMSEHTFGCHESGTKKPAMCAGFLLRSADHNITVRLDYITGRLKNDVEDGGHPLHKTIAPWQLPMACQRMTWPWPRAATDRGKPRSACVSGAMAASNARLRQSSRTIHSGASQGAGPLSSGQNHVSADIQ